MPSARGPDKDAPAWILPTDTALTGHGEALREQASAFIPPEGLPDRVNSRALTPLHCYLSPGFRWSVFSLLSFLQFSFWPLRLPFHARMSSETSASSLRVCNDESDYVPVESTTCSGEFADSSSSLAGAILKDLGTNRCF